MSMPGLESKGGATWHCPERGCVPLGAGPAAALACGQTTSDDYSCLAFPFVRAAAGLADAAVLRRSSGQCQVTQARRRVDGASDRLCYLEDAPLGGHVGKRALILIYQRMHFNKRAVDEAQREDRIQRNNKVKNLPLDVDGNSGDIRRSFPLEAGGCSFSEFWSLNFEASASGAAPGSVMPHMPDQRVKNVRGFHAPHLHELRLVGQEHRPVQRIGGDASVGAFHQRGVQRDDIH